MQIDAHRYKYIHAFTKLTDVQKAAEPDHTQKCEHTGRQTDRPAMACVHKPTSTPYTH